MTDPNLRIYMICSDHSAIVGDFVEPYYMVQYRVQSVVKRFLKIKIVPTLIFFRNGEQQEIYQTSNETEIISFFKTVSSYVS